MTTITSAHPLNNGLPRPLVRWREQPAVWLFQKLWLLATAVVCAYPGMLMAVAVYYLLTQVYQPFNDAWHVLIPDDHLRHTVRNVGEGFMGGLLGQQMAWDSYRYRNRSMHWLDRLEIRLGIANVKDGKPLSFRQLLASPFVALVYAIPGFALAMLVAYVVRHNAASMPQLATMLRLEDQRQIGGILNTLAALVTSDWEEKLAGLGAAFVFGRRPVKGVFDDMQGVFALRRVYRNQPPNRFYPPTYRARYNELHYLVSAAENIPIPHYGESAVLLMRAAVGGGALLAGFGAYVLLHVAQG